MELPAESSDNMEEGMNPENYGIERIIEALHTHCWPNREMKGMNSN